MTYLITRVNLRTDAAIMPSNEKKSQITASFLASPVNIAAFVVAVILLFFSLEGLSQAATAAPGWTLDSVAVPTNFLTSENTTCTTLTEEDGAAPYCDRYEVTAMNAGSEPTTASARTSTVISGADQ